MIFDLSNYWIFLAAIAAIYVYVSLHIQNNVGGKGRFRGVQDEMRQLQTKMIEASKKKDNKELDELFSQNWRLTMEMMKLQFQYLGIILVLLLLLLAFFPLVEPGMQDDVHLPLYDDGLASHCDLAAGDGIFSSCYTVPQGAEHGGWVVDAYLYSATNETMARNSTAIYVDGGKPSDIWLQSHTQTGIWDSMLGHIPHTLNVTAEPQNITAGSQLSIHVYSVPTLQQGEKLSAVLDYGTRFYTDLPFALPLINVSRIIGSYGVFIWYAFVLGILYSIGRSVYAAAMKKKQQQ